MWNLVFVCGMEVEEVLYLLWLLFAVNFCERQKPRNAVL